MVIQMTNRLLAVVIAVTVSTTLAAHAAQGSTVHLPAFRLGVHVPFATFGLRQPQVPAGMPAALQTAALSVTRQARAALDPKAVVTAAYQRDHDALEHLRQQAAALRSPAHASFNRLLDADQRTLATLERQALDYQSGDAASAALAMDRVVEQTRTALAAAVPAGAAGAVKPSHGHRAGRSGSQGD